MRSAAAILSLSSPAIGSGSWVKGPENSDRATPKSPPDSSKADPAT